MTTENTREYAGKTLEQMTLPELKEVCKVNELVVGEAKTKKDFIAVINAWEATLLVENANALEEKVGKTLNMGATLKKGGAGLTNVKAVEFHEGRLVVSKTPVSLNGKDYTDILVDNGSTYRVLAK